MSNFEKKNLSSLWSSSSLSFVFKSIKSTFLDLKIAHCNKYNDQHRLLPSLFTKTILVFKNEIGINILYHNSTNSMPGQKSHVAVKQRQSPAGRASSLSFPGFKSQQDSLRASSHLYPSIILPSAVEANKRGCRGERIGRGVKLFTFNEEGRCPW